MKKICIVHGRGANEKSCFIPDTKEKLEKRGNVRVLTPRIGLVPVIKKTIEILYKTIGVPDEKTFFVGHSHGNLALVTYLNWIGRQSFGQNSKLGGFYMVAPFHRVNKRAVRHMTAKKTNKFSWPINRLLFKWYNPRMQKNCDIWSSLPENYWDYVAQISKNNVGFYSNIDPFIDDEQFDFVMGKLNPEIHRINGASHFTSSDGFKEFPQLVDRIMMDLN